LSQLDTGRFQFVHGGLRKPPLVSLVGVAFDFPQGLMSADARNLFRGRATFREAPRRRFSQTMRAASGRQPASLAARRIIADSPPPVIGRPFWSPIRFMPLFGPACIASCQIRHCRPLGANLVNIGRYLVPRHVHNKPMTMLRVELIEYQPGTDITSKGSAPKHSPSSTSTPARSPLRRSSARSRRREHNEGRPHHLRCTSPSLR
jgi:hypothetical protein